MRIRKYQVPSPSKLSSSYFKAFHVNQKVKKIMHFFLILNEIQHVPFEKIYDLDTLLRNTMYISN